MTLFGLNLLVWATPLYLVALVRLVLRVDAAQAALARAMVWIAQGWIGGNGLILRLTQDIRWDVRGLEQLDQREWYLVLCNHQSWVDIVVLQAVFNRRIPFLKFFLKRELIRVPVLGLAWWALDFPFMQRHTKDYLAKHPEAKGADMAATRRACEHFRKNPTSVMNFVEGTRFTPEKHARLGSPHRHLLKPRAGGTAFVLGAMGDILHRVVDVTIVYPGGPVSFWQMACGQLEEVVVRATVRDIPAWVKAGDYASDREFRVRFQAWLGEMWRDKDALIEEILSRRTAKAA